MTTIREPIAEPVAPAEPFITVSPGPRNAWTDRETGLRFYQWRGRDLPSVTTVRRLAGMPHRLHQWTLTQVITRVVENPWALIKLLTRKRRPRERVLEKNRREEAARWLRQAATEERDASATLGLGVHDAAAAGVPLEAVPEEMRPRLRQFRHWLATSRAEILAAEFQVWNPTIGYAGTIDFLCRFPDGSIWVVDLKTGNGVYPEHLLQVLAYLMAEFVAVDDQVDQWLTALLHQARGVAVLHLADDHWEFRSLRADQDAWAAFVGLLRFATWSHQHPDIDGLTLGSRRGSAPEERAA